MPIAKITGQGLWVMALSVTLLWGCLAGEHVLLQRAQERRVRVLHELQQMRRAPGPNPSTAPVQARSHPMITVG